MLWYEIAISVQTIGCNMQECQKPGMKKWQIQIVLSHVEKRQN